MSQPVDFEAPRPSAMKASASGMFWPTTHRSTVSIYKIQKTWFKVVELQNNLDYLIYKTTTLFLVRKSLLLTLRFHQRFWIKEPTITIVLAFFPRCTRRTAKIFKLRILIKIFYQRVSHEHAPHALGFRKNFDLCPMPLMQLPKFVWKLLIELFFQSVFNQRVFQLNFRHTAT